MKRFLAFLSLLTLCAIPSHAQIAHDPLDNSYKPAPDCTAGDYPNNLWVTDGMVKVHQDSGSYVAGPCATPYAAKNEFEAFQIHEHAGGSSITLNNVVISDLVQSAPNSYTIHASTNVIVYREAYLNITQVSDYYGVTGYTPDILIPTTDPYYNQARNAFPFTISAGNNQSIWVEIQVPAAAPSGYYTGTATVTNGGSTYAVLPITLAVWNFSLPSTSTLQTMYQSESDGMCLQQYGSYAACSAFPGAGGNSDTALDLMQVDMMKLFLDHKTSVAAVYLSPAGNNFTTFDSRYSPVLAGTAPTLLSGAKLTNMFYQPFTRPYDATQLGYWNAHFVAQGWSTRLSAFICDEPPAGCTTWATINTWAAVPLAETPPVPTVVTTDIAKATANSVLSSISILTPIISSLDASQPAIGGTNTRSNYNSWIAGGGILFWYQDCVSMGVYSCGKNTPGHSDATWPSYFIDSTPVRNRVFQWMSYLYGVSGELYYDTDYCFTHFTDHCTTAGDGVTLNDPWTSVYAFGANGDGTLYYPGTTTKIGGTTPVPIPSVRLKLIRDGFEDYEYMNLLHTNGQDAFITTTVVTSGFITNAYTFSNTSADLQTARSALGNKLHQMSLGSSGSQAMPGTKATAGAAMR